MDPPPDSSRSPRRDLAPLLFLWQYLEPYRLQLGLALGALLAAAVAGLALPVAVRLVIDRGFSAGEVAAIDGYFLALFALAVLLAVFSAARYYLVTWLGERVVADLRNALYAHVLKLSPAFFEVTRTGEVLSRLTSDTTVVQAMSGVNLSLILRSSVMLLGGVVMLALTSPRLTGMILVLLPLVLVPVLVFGRRVRRLTRDTQDRIAEASGVAGETLQATEVVQAYNLAPSRTARFAEAVAASLRAAIARIRARALLTAFAISILFGAMVLVLWVGARSVVAGELTPGELGQFLLFAVVVAGSAASLSEMWSEVQRAAGALERIHELFQARADIVTPPDPVAMPQPPVGAIRFEEVQFHYASRPDTPAVEGVDIAIAPGETVALVGPSGAGKSTLFSLLLRFYDPQAGRILVDGVDIARVDPDRLRERMALVPQDTVVFADTLMQNIRFGREDATEEAVLAAARAAGVDAFATALPGGYHSFLGERGTRLSGGQRQRVAIARALLRDPPILLLDEATSALDAQSEALIKKALGRLTRNRTTLVIAHRLSTVMEADRILVMDRGRIVASGRHEELRRRSELYERLAAIQFDGAGVDDGAIPVSSRTVGGLKHGS